MRVELFLDKWGSIKVYREFGAGKWAEDTRRKLYGGRSERTYKILELTFCGNDWGEQEQESLNKLTDFKIISKILVWSFSDCETTLGLLILESHWI